MPSYVVALTAGAERDLYSICDFIEQTGGSEAVEEWLGRFERAIDALEAFPERGSVPAELGALGIRDFRQRHFRPFRIVYRVLDGRVFILIVAHGRRDFQSLLQERLLRG